MKGIVIVSRKDIEAHEGILASLEKNCEQVICYESEYHLYSVDGVLMTMICTLLDQEVEYRLNFANNQIFQK